MDKTENDQPSNDVDEKRVANRSRFELELEFVQSLANPYYLHSLAQQNILEQPSFINYLRFVSVRPVRVSCLIWDPRYLQYWKDKEYARFIQCAPPPVA